MAKRHDLLPETGGARDESMLATSISQCIYLLRYCLIHLYYCIVVNSFIRCLPVRAVCFSTLVPLLIRVIPHFRHYCEDCEWSAGTEARSRRELSALAIDHAIESGHDIDSEVVLI